MAPAKIHSKELMDSFKPVRVFLRVIAQLPFEIRERSDGVFGFKFEKTSFNAIIFGICTLLFSTVYILITFGLLSLLLEWRNGFYNITVEVSIVGSKELLWEEAMAENNIATIVITHCFLTITFVGGIYLLLYGSQYVHYCNYWMRVVQVMDMNPTAGVKSYLIKEIIVFIIIGIIEFIGFLFVVGIRATSGVYACMILRYIVPDLAKRDYFNIAQAMGFIIILYGHFAARALRIQFVFFAHLLKNISRIWNERLKVALDEYEKEDAEEAKAKRHEFRALLKDHYVIVQLFKMTEGTFSLILQVFYLGQFLSLLFQSIYLWKLLGPKSIEITTFRNKSRILEVFTPNTPPKLHERTEDEIFDDDQVTSESILAMTFLLQTLLTSYLTGAIAHAAHKEAMKGFQIIRRRGLLLCKTKTERNFIHTLVVSFARNIPVIITADGYFTLNKAFIVGIVATVAEYFVPIIQLDFPRYVIKENDYRMNWGAHITPAPI